ncbi:DUF6685 family protein [Enterobacter cancerogenus]
MNNDGPHHFSVAHYHVRGPGIAVLLTGRLCRYDVNVRMISALRQKWHLFTIPADELFCNFFDAMNALPLHLNFNTHHMHI